MQMHQSQDTCSRFAAHIQQIPTCYEQKPKNKIPTDPVLWFSTSRGFNGPLDRHRAHFYRIALQFFA